MIFLGFESAQGCWNIETGYHSFGPLNTLKDVIAFANPAKDGCTVEGVKFDDKDQRFFRVLLKFDRQDVSERLDYKFYIIYSTTEGRLYKQTIQYNRKVELWPPTELFLDTFKVSTD